MAFIYQQKPPRWQGRAILLTIAFCICVLIAGGLFLWCIITATRVRGADLELLKKKHGQMEYRFGDFERPTDGDIGSFGVYSPGYYQRRWRRMCDGPQRYDAMREADAMGRPMPCR